jgi:hypothetical protein
LVQVEGCEHWWFGGSRSAMHAARVH